MKARDVHSILRAVLADPCRAHGFSRFARRTGMWYREGTDRIHVWRVSLDARFGYNDPLGGRIFLRAWCSPTLPPPPDHPPLTPTGLLPEALLRRMKELTDPVTAKQLAGDWRPCLSQMDPQSRALCERFRADAEASLRTAYHAGMRLDEMGYVDEADVRNWAAFLVEALPHIAAGLAEREEQSAGSP